MNDITYSIQEVTISAPYKNVSWVYVLTNIFYTVNYDGQFTYMSQAVLDLSSSRSIREFKVAAPEMTMQHVMSVIENLLTLLPSDVKVEFRKADDNVILIFNEKGKARLSEVASETSEQNEADEEAMEADDGK